MSSKFVIRNQVNGKFLPRLALLPLWAAAVLATLAVLAVLAAVAVAVGLYLVAAVLCFLAQLSARALWRSVFSS